MKPLRLYQQQAVADVLSSSLPTCLVSPTGSGASDYVGHMVPLTILPVQLLGRRALTPDLELRFDRC